MARHPGSARPPSNGSAASTSARQAAEAEHKATAKRTAAVAPKRSATALRRPDRRSGDRLGQHPDAIQIARRAFLLFLERGAKHGHDIEDWLRAEQELMADADRRH